MQAKTFDLTHTPDLWGQVERSDFEIVQLSLFLIELSMLALKHSYDLNDTQGELNGWKNGIYVL